MNTENSMLKDFVSEFVRLERAEAIGTVRHLQRMLNQARLNGRLLDVYRRRTELEDDNFLDDTVFGFFSL